MDKDKLEELRQATEQRKKGELDDIEDVARNKIAQRFGDPGVDQGTAQHQEHTGSNSLRTQTPSDSQRRDVQISDANPDAADRKERRSEKDEAA